MKSWKLEVESRREISPRREGARRGECLTRGRGGTDAHIAALTAYGNHLGLAFQIIDDVLDEPERAAKTDPELSGLDLWSAEEARHHAAEHTRLAYAGLAGLPGPVEPLRALVAHLLERKT